MMHHVATMYDTVKEMHINIEVSNLLTSLIDIVVDAENKAIVVDLTTNLQLLQQEQNDTTETVQKLQEERTTYMKEATLLRDQLVHDYRNMLGQLDESRRQLAERPTTNITNIMAATPSSSQQQQQQQHSFAAAPPPYIAQAPVQLQQPPLQPPPTTSDVVLQVCGTIKSSLAARYQNRFYNRIQTRSSSSTWCGKNPPCSVGVQCPFLPSST